MPGMVSDVSATLVARITRRCGMLAKTLRLLGRREARVERLHDRVPQVPREELVLGLADLALAGQEHEDVAARIERRDVRRPALATASGRSTSLARRLVEHVDRVGAALDLDDGRAAEELGEALGLERRRADDDLQVGPLGQDALQPAEQKVDGQAALVRLVDDDRVVPREAADRPGSRRGGCRRS